ncbi:MAG: PAS domain S-box protein, partial [Caldilineaceae bacterium]
MPDPARTLHQTQRSLWISLALGVLATTVLVSTLLLAVLITLQIQELGEGVAYSQTIVNSNMRALSQAQREILRLVALLERDAATPEQIDLLRGFISQRAQEASLSYQVYTLGSEDLFAASLALRDEWRDGVEPLVRQIAAGPGGVTPAIRAQAIEGLERLELGYNRLVSEGEINRRLQGAALNESAQATLDATRSVILILGLSAVAFVGLAALAAWNFARLTRQRELVAEALVAANRELQTLSAVASRTRNLVVMTDGQGLIEWVNDAFVTHTGYSLAESLGKSPGALLQGEHSDPATVQYMAERIAAGLPFEAEIVNTTRDGREFWIAIEAQPIVDETGATTHYVAIETDITTRKET